MAGGGRREKENQPNFVVAEGEVAGLAQVRQQINLVQGRQPRRRKLHGGGRWHACLELACNQNKAVARRDEVNPRGDKSRAPRC